MRIISLDYETFYAKNYSIRGSIVESYSRTSGSTPT